MPTTRASPPSPGGCWSTGTTGRRDPTPFYFCQLEAIETLIWWVEAPAEHTQGIAVPGDGGPWDRICSKMATGTGKTTVMAMLVTWQVLNALTYPKRTTDFSRTIFIVAPGLTVKERLQVLIPGGSANYYDVRLGNGRMLVLEIKGQDGDEPRAKRTALDMWVRAVNQKGGFGSWSADAVSEMPRMHDAIDRALGHSE